MHQDQSLRGDIRIITEIRALIPHSARFFGREGFCPRNGVLEISEGR